MWKDECLAPQSPRYWSGSFSFISFQSVFPKALLLSTQWKCLVGSFSYLMWRELGLRVEVCVWRLGGSMGSWQFVKGVREEVEQPVEWVWLRAEGWTDRGEGWRGEVWVLPTGVWNSYFVIWNMSEISNEIWSITASHTSQWNALSVCVSACVCFWKCVVIFILKHWGVRWEGGGGWRGGEKKGGREGGRGGGFSTWTYWSFTVLSEVFFHLSGPCQGGLSVLRVHMYSVWVWV